MGTGPQYVIAQLNEDGVPVAIGPDNPLYIEGGDGGSAFPVTSPDGQVTIDFGNDGLSVAGTTGPQTLSGPSGFSVLTSSGEVVLAILESVGGGSADVTLESVGVGGLLLSGNIRVNSTVTQLTGSAVDPMDLVTKGYVDGKIPIPPATGNYTLKSVDGAVSRVEDTP